MIEVIQMAANVDELAFLIQNDRKSIINDCARFIEVATLADFNTVLLFILNRGFFSE